MGALNHIDIVSAIADRQSRLVRTILLDELDEGCLLHGRRAIDHKTFGLHEGVYNSLTSFLVFFLFYSIDQKSNGGTADHHVLAT